MSKILLGPSVRIDLDKLIESRLLVQANSGGGKSWAIRRIIEQSFGEKQIIIIDPEGEFGNLRSKFDFVYCGKDGDAPVESRSAALLAHRLLELKASAIVDLYELPPQERKHFVRLFCGAMVNAPKELWHDVLIIIDEAHVFAPEKGESEAMGPVIDLATRGRKRGYCVVLATQRLPKLNKDAAAECNNKLIGRASQDIDRKRAAEELGFTTKEQTLSLRDLDPGEFYVFGPAVSRDVIRVTIGDVEVKPPKRGISRGKVAAPSATIKKILSRLSDLPQEAKKEAQTSAELRAELATLKRHKCPVVPPAGASKEEIAAAVKEAEKRKDLQYFAERDEWLRHMNTLFKIIAEVGNAAADLKKTIGRKKILPPPAILAEPIKPVPMPGRDEIHERKITIPLPPPGTVYVRDENQKALSKGARAILTYLHQSYPHWKSKTQMWVATGYAPGGGFNNYIYELTGIGLIEVDGTGKYASTERHEHPMLLEDFNVDLSKWDSKLALGARKIFKILLDNETESFSKESLVSMTGYAPGGGFNNYIYELTGKELIKKVGTGYQVNPEILDL